MSFVPHHEVLAQEAARRTALVLHGALGSGQNFRGFAKKLMEVRPDYAFVLVDLRAHGRSRSAPAPHTLQSAASDLTRLVEALRRDEPQLPDVRCLIGHSLGGKVALECARLGADWLGQVFLLDSNPGTQDPAAAHEIRSVLQAIRGVPMPAASRAQVVGHLRAQGLSSGLSNWMTTNLERRSDELYWVFDLTAIEELLVDYFRQDLWPYLEQERQGPEVQLIVAEQSDRWSADMRERALHLSEATRARTRVLPQAGHWLHVDNPEGLLELMRSLLAP